MKEKTDALSRRIDHEEIDLINIRVDNLSREVESMVDNIVDETCKDLDDYMKRIDDILVNQQEPVTDYQLDDFTLNLPSLLYLASSSQENLGIKDDVSRAVRNEIYNRVRQKAEGTVADKDTAAELASQAEAVVSIVYSRAYKKVKLRIEAAYEMLNSVKKVVTRRIAEYELAGKDKGV